MARRKGKGKKAYLKHSKSFYDPYSPYALRTRGAKGINIGALARGSDGVLHSIEYSVTQTHGKRGLTLSRADGPTQVAIGVDSVPSVVPRAQVALRIFDAKAEDMAKIWHNWRRQGVTRFNRILLEDIPNLRKLELWFAGREFMFVRTSTKRRIECRSRVYGSREEAMSVYEGKNGRHIQWVETLAIPPPAT